MYDPPGALSTIGNSTNRNLASPNKVTTKKGELLLK